MDMKKIIVLILILFSSTNFFGQKDAAILYFVRPDNFAGKLLDLKIIINNVEICKISNNSHFVYKISKAGEAKIVLKAIGTPPKSIVLQIDKGEKYYFMVGFTAMGKFIKRVNFEDVKNNISENQDVVVENPKNVENKKDEKAPIITVSNPKVTRGFKLTHESEEIKIVGKAVDESGIFKLTVNGNNTPVDGNGNFQSLQVLNPGTNEIKIIAIDTQDNTAEFSFFIDSKTNNVVSNEIVKPTEKRIALIIGNSDYKSCPLRNPVNDATLMTSELKKLGFEVNTLKNGSQNHMKQAISKFGESLAKDKNTVGLFYYAGHGIQVKGKNYLVPTDAVIEKEPDVEVYCVDLDGLLANLEYSGNNMNIIILDACRNNPFGRGFRSQASNGLATINAPVGTIIAYATAPGSVAADGDGQNGLYTQEFAKALSVPNLKIEDVFKKVRTQVKTLSEGKQIPWENSSIEGDFYFIKQK
jgi:hypothetical protein